MSTSKSDKNEKSKKKEAPKHTAGVGRDCKRVNNLPGYNLKKRHREVPLHERPSLREFARAQLREDGVYQELATKWLLNKNINA